MSTALTQVIFPVSPRAIAVIGAPFLALVDTFEKPLDPETLVTGRRPAAAAPAPPDHHRPPLHVVGGHLPTAVAAAVGGAVAVVAHDEDVARFHHLERPFAVAEVALPALEEIVAERPDLGP